MCVNCESSCIYREGSRLPLLADVEAPLKREVRLLVVVDEAGDGVVVAAGEHAGRSLLLLDCWGRIISSGRSEICNLAWNSHFFV